MPDSNQTSANTVKHPLTLRERYQVETHQCLLESGARAFAQYGFHGAKIAAVTRDAGVAHGTFYLHFKDKEALYREIVAITIEKLLKKLRQVRETITDPDTSNRREIEVIVDYAEENAGLVSVLTAQGIKRQDPIELFSIQREKELTAGQKAGDIADDLDPVILARAEVGLLLTVIQWWINGSMSIKKKHLVDNLIQLRGLWIKKETRKNSI